MWCVVWLIGTSDTHSLLPLCKNGVDITRLHVILHLELREKNNTLYTYVCTIVQCKECKVCINTLCVLTMKLNSLITVWWLKLGVGTSTTVVMNVLCDIVGNACVQWSVMCVCVLTAAVSAITEACSVSVLTLSIN